MVYVGMNVFILHSYFFAFYFAQRNQHFNSQNKLVDSENTQPSVAWVDGENCVLQSSAHCDLAFFSKTLTDKDDSRERNLSVIYTRWVTIL